MTDLFDPTMTGAASQMHGGPNQHLLQGNVPGGGGNLGIPQFPFGMQPGKQRLLGATRFTEDYIFFFLIELGSR